MRTSRSFAPEAGSIPAARRFVLAAAGDVGKDRHDAIAVMASELAMNAVQYAHTEFTVTIEITGGTLRVEVTDSAPGTPEPGQVGGEGVVEPGGADGEFHRGLGALPGRVLQLEQGAVQDAVFGVTLDAGKDLAFIRGEGGDVDQADDVAGLECGVGLVPVERPLVLPEHDRVPSPVRVGELRDQGGGLRGL